MGSEGAVEKHKPEGREFQPLLRYLLYIKHMVMPRENFEETV